MDQEADALHQPLQQLENVAREYARLEKLITAAAQGQNLSQRAEQSVLFANPQDGRIVDCNDAATDLLGYSRPELLGLTIQNLERADEKAEAARTYIELSIEEHVSLALYRHRSGDWLPVRVSRRQVQHGDVNLLHYRLEDRSLYKRLWHELQRREDEGFKFQQKLQALNEVTLALSQVETQDALCRDAIRFAIERLGLDRLSIWFLDAQRGVMVGSYGVDENGQLRAEHTQQWSYKDTYIDDFIAGKTEASQALDDAPIYNEKSEMIELGWHISAPILHGAHFIGVLTADNFLHRQPMKRYEPELLRLYGITLGHLLELMRTRQQVVADRLERERTQILQQFIMNVSHDFRTPLAVISTSAYLLESASEFEQRHKLSHAISQQVHGISDILSRMLTLIEIEWDPHFTFTATDLQMLIEELAKSQHTKLVAKHLQCEVAPGPPAIVQLDADQMRFALGELLDNAIRYTSENGSIELRITCDAGETVVRIRDNGVGIAQDELQSIFSPLYRTDKARTEQRNGLGLALARSIVQAHHGRIAVQSTLGSGSTFEIIMPYKSQ